MSPLLQIAIDTTSEEDFFFRASLVINNTDILEIGTPTIISNGLDIVRKARRMYPGAVIYADLKSIDFTIIETQEAFERGANFVSVMIVADDDNVVNALKIAKKNKGEIVFSTMGYPAICLESRILRIQELGGRNFIAHGSGTTQKRAFGELIKKIKILSQISGIQIFAGGGINIDNIQTIIKRWKPYVIIIGRGVFEAENVQSTIQRIKGSYRTIKM